MRRINQKGFTALEIILCLTLIVILGLGGWYVWRNNKTNKKTTANNSTHPTVSNKTTSSTNPKSDATDTTKYLTVKEWGVKLPLSSDILDAYYVYKDSTPQDGESTVYLGTKSLTALDPDCAPDKVGTVAIFRQTPAIHDLNATSSDPVGKDIGNTNIGDYDFGLNQSQAFCSSTTNSEANNKQSVAKTAFTKAFDDISAAN